MSIRARIAAGLTTAVLALSLTACATPVSPGPTDPAGIEPSPSITMGTPSPSASRAAGEAEPDEIDDVEVGESFADETAEIPGFAVVEGCAWVGTASRDGYELTVQREEPGDDGSPIVLVSASVAADDVTAAGPVTEKGIGIGSTLAETRDAYPDAQEVPSESDRRYLRVAEDDGSALFLSYTEGADVIWAVTATSLDAPPYEPCA